MGQRQNQRLFESHWNSPLHSILETRQEVERAKSQRIRMRDSGWRIDYTELNGAILIATHVKDLRISILPSGEELMEWTLSPHLDIDRKTGETIETTKRIKRSYKKTNQ